MRIAGIWSGGLVLAAACARGAGSKEWAGKLDTLPSGRVIVTNPGDGIWGRNAGWRVVEEVRIGAADGTGPEVLGQLSVLAEDIGGRIWALESEDQTFKVFAPDGRFIRTVGHKGGGPGEMRQVAGVAQTRDGCLLVVDPQGARISVSNNTSPEVGARIRVSWHRSDFEVPSAAAARAAVLSPGRDQHTYHFV